MNQEEKEDMARYVIDVNEQWGTTIILIEHDMAVVMDISDQVTVLDRGRRIADGTPAEVQRNPEVIGPISAAASAGSGRHERPMASGPMAIDMTLPQLLRRNAERTPDRPALREKDRGIWQTYSWRRYFERCANSRWGWRRKASAAATSCR